MVDSRGSRYYKPGVFLPFIRLCIYFYFYRFPTWYLRQTLSRSKDWSSAIDRPADWRYMTILCMSLFSSLKGPTTIFIRYPSNFLLYFYMAIIPDIAIAKYKIFSLLLSGLYKIIFCGRYYDLARTYISLFSNILALIRCFQLSYLASIFFSQNALLDFILNYAGSKPK